MITKRNGFSLLELICCVAICCGICAVVFPALTKIKTNLVAKTAAIELLGDLQLAKLAAIKYNCYVVVLFEDSNYRIFVDDGNEGGVAADWIQQSNEKTLVKREIPPALSTSVSYGKNRLRFDGIIGMQAGSIRMQSQKGDNYSIVINNYSRLRLKKES